jgi:hypothetical protein
LLLLPLPLLLLLLRVGRWTTARCAALLPARHYTADGRVIPRSWLLRRRAALCIYTESVRWRVPSLLVLLQLLLVLFLGLDSGSLRPFPLLPLGLSNGSLCPPLLRPLDGVGTVSIDPVHRLTPLSLARSALPRAIDPHIRRRRRAVHIAP